MINIRLPLLMSLQVLPGEAQSRPCIVTNKPFLIPLSFQSHQVILARSCVLGALPAAASSETLEGRYGWQFLPSLLYITFSVYLPVKWMGEKTDECQGLEEQHDSNLDSS